MLRGYAAGSSTMQVIGKRRRRIGTLASTEAIVELTHTGARSDADVASS